tara:strand:+ start:1640 stop:2065 length:426 start_codon:yes stop_codon:yes gene_type:complete
MSNRIEVIYMGLSECSKQFCLEIEGQYYWWPRKYDKHFYSSPGAIFSVEGDKNEDGRYSLVLSSAIFEDYRIDVSEDVKIRHAIGERVISAERQGKKAAKDYEVEEFGELTLNQLKRYLATKGKDAKAGLIAKVVSHLDLW